MRVVILLVLLLLLSQPNELLTFCYSDLSHHHIHAKDLQSQQLTVSLV
jgi:hypothetical protein